MLIPLNQDIAGGLDEVSRILAEQGANRFCVQAYQHAATAVRKDSQGKGNVLTSTFNTHFLPVLNI